LTAIKDREDEDSNSTNVKLAEDLETTHREERNRVDSICLCSDGSYESVSSNFENETQEDDVKNELPAINYRCSVTKLK